MLQRMSGTVADEWIHVRTESVLPRSEAPAAPQSRSHAADILLRGVSCIVASLAIDPAANRDLLFDQYDYKLRSQGGSLGRFCLSVAPAIAGMAMVCGAFKVIRKLRPQD